MRISEDYKSYHADKKLLEKVSNLSKLSRINQTYKYELAYLNKKFTPHDISVCLLWTVQNPQFRVYVHSVILVNKAQ